MAYLATFGLASAIVVLLIFGIKTIQPQMPNDQIIAEVRKCEANGLIAVTINGFNGRTVGIACQPKLQAKPYND